MSNTDESVNCLELESRIMRVLKDYRDENITAEEALDLIDELTNKVPTFEELYDRVEKRLLADPLFFHED